jgi:hypothetical protein
LLTRISGGGSRTTLPISIGRYSAERNIMADVTIDLGDAKDHNDYLRVEARLRVILWP